MLERRLTQTAVGDCLKVYVPSLWLRSLMHKFSLGLSHWGALILNLIPLVTCLNRLTIFHSVGVLSLGLACGSA